MTCGGCVWILILHGESATCAGMTCAVKHILFIMEEGNSKKEKRSFVKDMPKNERPREKLLTKGTNAMYDYELLAIILRTGIKGEHVLDFALRVLKEVGSLENLFDASMQDLMKIKGIGLAKAAEITSCITLARRFFKEKVYNENFRLSSKSVNDSSAAADFIRKHIEDFSKEHFFVLNLDVRNRIIDVELISKGTLTASLVHPRETFESAIRKHSACIIVAHNHPSGDITPSEEDIRITRRLKDAGKILGIELLDHLILTKDKICSLKEKGFI
jgi:DNA repair protein RadC